MVHLEPHLPISQLIFQNLSSFPRYKRANACKHAHPAHHILTTSITALNIDARPSRLRGILGNSIRFPQRPYVTKEDAVYCHREPSHMNRLSCQHTTSPTKQRGKTSALTLAVINLETSCLSCLPSHPLVHPPRPHQCPARNHLAVLCPPSRLKLLKPLCRLQRRGVDRTAVQAERLQRPTVQQHLWRNARHCAILQRQCLEPRQTAVAWRDCGDWVVAAVNFLKTSLAAREIWQV